jgi:hypothetical protein
MTKVLKSLLSTSVVAFTAFMFTSFPASAGWVDYFTADDAVELRVPFKPGGLSGQLAETLAASADKSLNAKVEYLGNCKSAQQIFEKGEGELYIYPLAHASIGKCQWNMTSDNVVDIPYAQTLSMCYQTSRSELGADHYRSNAEKTVATVYNWMLFANSWNKDMGLSNAKVITVGRASDVLAASYTNESDYYLLDTSTAVKHTDRLTCIFNTGDTNVNNTITLKEFAPEVKNSLIYHSQMLVTPDTTKVTKLREIAKKLKVGNAWNTRTSDPGVKANIDDPAAFFTEQTAIIKEVQ